MERTINILRKCKINAKYRGYLYIPEAVHILENNYDEPLQITNDIYPQIAEKYEATVPSVEHAIRTVIERCWINDKDYVDAIIGYRTTKCPTNMEFIDALVYYIMHIDNK